MLDVVRPNVVAPNSPTLVIYGLVMHLYLPWFLGHRDKKIEIILIIMQPKEPLQVQVCQVSLAFLIDENAVKIASVNAP
jgi:hypothetical protein